MRKLSVKSILLLFVCFAKELQSASVAINSECITNPTANPTQCVNHINAVMRHLESLNPSMRIRNGEVRKAARNSPGLARKSNVQSQFEDSQNDVIIRDKPTSLSKLIEMMNSKIQRRPVSNNADEEEGEDVMQTLTDILRRVGVHNILKGHVVNSRQVVKEYNLNDRVHPVIRKRVLKDVIKDLVRSLQRIAITNDISGDIVKTDQTLIEHNYDELSDDVKDAIRRITMVNNLKGVKVDTNQDIKEYNGVGDDVLSNLANAIRRIAIKNSIKGTKVNTKQHVEEHNNDELGDDIQAAIRRISMVNNLKGGEVTTKQDVKEFNNNELSDDLMNNIRRVAIKNDISGDVVETEQDVEEHNSFAKKLADTVRRIAMQNKIKGKTVSTKQDIKEFNSKQASAEQEDETSEARRIALKNDIRGNSVNTAQNLMEYNIGRAERGPQGYQDETSEPRRIAVKNDIQGNSVNTAQNLMEYNNGLATRGAQGDESLPTQDDFHESLRKTANMYEYPDQQARSQYAEYINRLAQSRGLVGPNMIPGAMPAQMTPAAAFGRRFLDENDDVSTIPMLTRDHKLENLANENEEADDNDEENNLEENADAESANEENLMDDETRQRDLRRMTVNNNLAASKRRISLANDISGGVVNTEMKVEELNGSKKGNADVEVADVAVGATKKEADTEESKKVTKPKKTQRKCKKTNLTDAQLKKFLDVLAKTNSPSEPKNTVY